MSKKTLMLFSFISVILSHIKNFSLPYTLSLHFRSGYLYQKFVFIQTLYFIYLTSNVYCTAWWFGKLFRVFLHLFFCMYIVYVECNNIHEQWQKSNQIKIGSISLTFIRRFIESCKKIFFSQIWFLYKFKMTLIYCFYIWCIHKMYSASKKKTDKI